MSSNVPGRSDRRRQETVTEPSVIAGDQIQSPMTTGTARETEAWLVTLSLAPLPDDAPFAGAAPL
jgi:hypothetical protein